MIKNAHGTFIDKQSYYAWCEVVGLKPLKTFIHKKDPEELAMVDNYDLIKRRRLLDADNET